jgi:hypothetical protein
MARRLMALFGGAVLVLAMTAGSALAAPGNDSALTPTVIGSLPFTDTVDTTTATADPTDPSSPCGSASNTVWYTLTAGPSGIGHVILDMAGTDYPVLLYVTAGSPGGPLVSCGNVSSITFDAAPSTTYYIMIGDAFAAGAGGILVFSATQGLTFAATLDRFASVNAKTGTVIVSGTYSCNLSSTVVAVEVSLKQAVGRFIISGNGASTPDAACSPGTSYSWAVQVVGSNGKFAGGKATAWVNVYGYDGTGSWNANLGPVQISLRK